MRQSIPRRWPLNPRLLASTEERKVWHWLNETFAGHHIMVKLPVTRFTLPRSKEQGLHWYKLLSGVYCTLTVCAPDGRVLGCVDVPGNKRISRSNRQLKQTLLSQCGIAYWVISSAHLPTAQEIRNEFLGEAVSPPPPRPEDEDKMAATHLKLRASLSGQRKGRHSDWAPLKPTAGDSPDGDSEFSNFGSGLHQENSFLVPLDSRKGTLR
ncbi:hypothetical protein [Polaromonas sp.]|uniref:DUF2726 domain-containing protein n=1 Tax=Polaromonas sp. TaxID=1869339 RepID=UPI0018409CBD|nr:hypothetical protein [Polaromonas sp.]NMM06480.1 DUF2726 domain-containing protein [Polaromonas sp.]